MREWLLRRTGPKAGTPAYAVQEAWIEMANAARGSEARQDAAWQQMWDAARAANATDVIESLRLIEASHEGGPLTYEQAVKRLRRSIDDLVAESKHG